VNRVKCLTLLLVDALMSRSCALTHALAPGTAEHGIRLHDTFGERLHHPLVGDLELTFEVMTLVADSELTMFAFTAEPNTKSEEARAGRQRPTSLSARRVGPSLLRAGCAPSLPDTLGHA
jgi:hypothetical protein